MSDLVKKLNRGKVIIFWIILWFGLFAYALNYIVFLRNYSQQAYHNIIAIAILIIVGILYFTKAISLHVAFGIGLYTTIIINYYSQFLGIGLFENWAAYQIQDIFVLAILCGFSAIVLAPVHALIISGINFIGLTVLTIYTNNEFLLENVAILIALFTGYGLGVYFFFRLFHKMAKEQQLLFETIQEKNEEILQHNEELTVQQEILEQQNNILQEKNLEIERQRNNLQKSNDTKNLLFSIIAHDLRSPIGMVLSFSTLFRKRFNQLNNEKKLKYIDSIHSLTDKTYKLLENLLNWAKGQSNNLAIEYEELHIEELFEDVIDVNQNRLQQKNILVERNLNCTKISSDKEILLTILRNLFSNAIKFSNTDGKIEVGCGITDNNEVIIYIQDFGIGMSPQLKAKIFDTNKEKVMAGTSGEIGTGLGLMVCKEFVEKLNGAIEVETVSGQGTRFTLRLSE